MSSIISQGGQHRSHTRTPKAEAGGVSRRSSVSSSGSDSRSRSRSSSVGSEDDLVLYSRDTGNASAVLPPDRLNNELGDESDTSAQQGEEQQLLNGVTEPRSVRRTKFGHLRLEDGPSRIGWISIFGFSLPKPLLYLFAFPSLLLVLYVLSHLFHNSSHTRHATLNNGTHPFHPTTLLISLDGFRPSYINTHPHILSNLIALGNSKWGVKAESMQPVFPTLTFPNHWSIMTGLYPESHGIIANDFWDPQFPSAQAHANTGSDSIDNGAPRRAQQEKSDRNHEQANNGVHFVYTEEDKSWDGAWWWGEPIWSVVERMKRKSAVIMWPGPPVTSAGIAPSYFVPYRDLAPLKKLDQIFEYVDKPIADRPEFIAAYFPEIDQNGHRSGPQSLGVNHSLAAMDEMIVSLVKGLEQRNLDDIVNVLIVSDHGMTETSNSRLIYLDEILGEEGIEAIEHEDGWPSVGLRFKEGTDVDLQLQKLLDAAGTSNGTFAVYTHETMPERWHFSHGHRIAPIYVVPTLGWAITNHHEHFVIYQGDYQPKGNHGYDNMFPEMQAIFFARGPIAQSMKTQSELGDLVAMDPPVLKSFRNLELFSLVTCLLGIENIDPPHNGTRGFWDKYLQS